MYFLSHTFSFKRMVIGYIYLFWKKNIAILCTMHAGKISVILHDYALENIYLPNFYRIATSSDAPDVGTLFAWAVSIFFSNCIPSENKIFVWWIQTNIPDSLSWLSRRKVFSIKNFFWNSKYIFTCRSHRAQLTSKELCT